MHQKFEIRDAVISCSGKFCGCYNSGEKFIFLYPCFNDFCFRKYFLLIRQYCEKIRKYFVKAPLAPILTHLPRQFQQMEVGALKMMIDAFDGYGLIYTCYNGVKQFVRQFLFFVNLQFHKILSNLFTILSCQQKILSYNQKSLKQGYESMNFSLELVSTHFVWVDSLIYGRMD